VFTKKRFQWVNGATVYRMANVQKMIAAEGYQDEDQFSALANKWGWHLAFFHALDARTDNPPKWSPEFFRHVGRGVSSLRRQDICAGESFT
jgi:hypothetical protein